MPLTPPENMQTREAILSYGVWGSGKSEDWATIGEVYRMTRTPGHFHILSTEWERALQISEGYDDFFDNSTIYEVEDFPSLIEASRKIRDMGTRDDWCIVDSLGNAQTWARDEWFQANRGGLTYRDFLATGGAAKDIGAAGWITMSERYKSWVNPYIVRFPGHKYACAQADTVNTEGVWSDKGAIRNLFGRIGLKPAAEKESGYIFRSVLLKTNPTKGEYAITTVKDSKNRDYLTNEVVAPLPMGFVHTFLMEVAGWTINE